MGYLNYPKFILFGDSLTQQSFDPERNGFGTLLSNAYARKVDVLNRGFSGYTSRWLLPLFRDILGNCIQHSEKALLFVIFVGANDACLPGTPHHVPLDEYKSNLRTMITELRTCSATESTKVVIVTAPPIDPIMLHNRGNHRRLVNKTREYVVATLDVSKEFERDQNVASIDFHEVVLREVCKEGEAGCGENDAEGTRVGVASPHPALDGILTDGLHLDTRGYAILYRELMKVLGERWPQLLPNNVPLTSPWWGDLVSST